MDIFDFENYERCINNKRSSIEITYQSVYVII